MIEEALKDISIDDVFSGLNSYIDFYNNSRPKVFYRKNRFKGKCKRTYIMRYNPLHELLISPIFLVRSLKMINRGGRI